MSAPLVYAGDAKRFKNVHQIFSWMRLTPYQNSCSGNMKLKGITKNGNLDCRNKRNPYEKRFYGGKTFVIQ
ncbi:transposase [Xenorhabdus bovienii]|uniref:transposase n=1 Tax=Xenorhabdus bovienii TaxID=40576 RepID=UPI0039B66902